MSDGTASPDRTGDLQSHNLWRTLYIQRLAATPLQNVAPNPFPAPPGFRRRRSLSATRLLPYVAYALMALTGVGGAVAVTLHDVHGATVPGFQFEKDQ